jgi:hypothetical protein
MLSGRPEQTADEETLLEARPACAALVPPVPSAQSSPAPSRLPRPNATFVTHLIATAEQIPQTRGLRRATAADAQRAYRPRQFQLQRAGIRTRQTI